VFSDDLYLDGVALSKVFLDDAEEFLGRDMAIPDSLRINDHPRASGADAEAGSLRAQARHAKAGG